jgi:hypothetical protein
MLGLGNSLSSSAYISSGNAASAYSMSFDGSGDYLSFTATAFAIGDDGDKFSISFWAKRDTTATAADFVMSNVNGYYRKINFTSAGDKLEIEGDTNGQSAYGAVTADTNWHHYVITLNNDNGTGNTATIAIYEDGSAVSTSVSSLGASTANLTVDSIGSPSGGGSNGFNGLLYQIAIYDEILDASAVSAIYNSGTPIDITADSGGYDNSEDLTNLWNLTEGTGSTAADSVGSLDATLNGDAAFSTTTPS